MDKDIICQICKEYIKDETFFILQIFKAEYETRTSREYSQEIDYGKLNLNNKLVGLLKPSKEFINQNAKLFKTRITKKILDIEICNKCNEKNG